MSPALFCGTHPIHGSEELMREFIGASKLMSSGAAVGLSIDAGYNTSVDIFRKLPMATGESGISAVADCVEERIVCVSCLM
jgi:hypothetical protein